MVQAEEHAVGRFGTVLRPTAACEAITISTFLASSTDLCHLPNPHCPFFWLQIFANNWCRLLDISRCVQLTAESLSPLFQHSPRLQRLNVSSVDSMSSEMLHLMRKHCTELQEVNLSWCRAVTDEMVVDLAQACTHLRKIHLWGCHKTTECVNVVSQKRRGVVIFGAAQSRQ